MTAHPAREHLLPLLALALLAVTGDPLRSQETGPRRTLVVATRHAPPFAIRSPEGSWSGLSVELWREIAEDLDLKYELREMSLADMLRGLEDGSVDVAAGALTVTAARETVMDFSHPFHGSGLGLAVQARRENGWSRALGQLFSPELVQILGVIAGLLLLSGVVAYFLERRANPEQFSRGFFRGLGDGVWWAAVTMTTVGYGDKVPRTLPGRLLALVWMLSGIILIAGFTAAATATLTAERLRPRVQGPEDLARTRVASVAGSTGAEFLKGRHLAFRGHPDAEQALDSLAAGKCGAVVYDAPILRYLVRQRGGDLLVLPRTFERQDYALAFPTDSPLREPSNRALLRIIATARWDESLGRYVGSP